VTGGGGGVTGGGGGASGGGGGATSGGGSASDGPQVTMLQRFGIHRMPTTLLLHFDQPLDATRARDVNEYKLVGPRGKLDPIVSASYDPATMTVTLHPKRSVNLHDPYTLTVDGTSPAGLTNSSGQFLDGKGSAEPGSDYIGKVDWRNVVLPDSRRKSTRNERTVELVRRPVPVAQPRAEGGHLFDRSLSIPAAVHRESSAPRLRHSRVVSLARRLPEGGGSTRAAGLLREGSQ
jgi:hypothetical protein